MSRMEYIDDNVEQTSDVYIHRPNYGYSCCSTCYEPHVNGHTGITSFNQKNWFCSAACQTLFWYDNKLANYAPETVSVLETMRKKFYTSEKLEKNKKKYYRN